MWRRAKFDPKTQEELCHGLVGTPYHDETGKEVGRVSRAWIDAKGRVVIDIEFHQQGVDPIPHVVHDS